MPRFVLTALLAVLPLLAMAQSRFDWPYHEVNGQIVTDTPPMPAGQKTALKLATPKLKIVRVGFVGLGMRGSDAVRRWTYLDSVKIVALCDYEPDRAEKANEQLRKAGLPNAALYSGEEGYKKLCERKDIDLVYIATDWEHHFPVAKYAMEHGKHVAIEVPSAMNLRQCWELVDLSERLRLHCMMLENCCYDFFELQSLTLAQKGLLGEVLYATGSYRHDLTPFWDEYWRRDSTDRMGWRLDYNMKHRGDIYATHGLGPVAQVMNIHRGDYFTTLQAVDTKSVNGKALAAQHLGAEPDSFLQGDVTTTFLRTAKGHVVEIQHNTMTPEPYSRMYQLTGTRGFVNKYPVEGIALSHESMVASGITKHGDYWEGEAFMPKEDVEQLSERYPNPLVTTYVTKAKEVGGHGGMDFIMDSRLVYCLRHGLPLDIDVYDLAEWCSLAELGSISLNNGGKPVVFPDFTRGHQGDVKGFSYAF